MLYCIIEIFKKYSYYTTDPSVKRSAEFIKFFTNIVCLSFPKSENLYLVTTTFSQTNLDQPSKIIIPDVNEEAGHQLKTPLKIELRSYILYIKNINYLGAKITERKCT